MIKKVLILILMPVALFATEFDGPSVDLVLNFQAAEYFFFGFSSSPYSSSTPVVGSFTNNEVAFDAEAVSDGNASSIKADGERIAYAFWDIVSNNPVDISLAISGPLTDVNDHSLDWYISWGGTTPGTISSEGQTTPEYKLIASLSPTDSNVSFVDNRAITIGTDEDVFGKPSGRYSAAIIMKVEQKG